MAEISNPSPTNSSPLTGRCQCGAIEYKITAPFLLQVACHCRECQKYTAGAFGITAVIPQQAFVLTKGKLKKWSRPAESGNIVDCYFCQDCGNRIYHHNPDRPELIKFKPGTLADTSVIKPEMHVWVKSRQPWIEIPPGVQCFDQQPEI